MSAEYLKHSLLGRSNNAGSSGSSTDPDMSVLGCDDGDWPPPPHLGTAPVITTVPTIIGTVARGTVPIITRAHIGIFLTHRR